MPRPDVKRILGGIGDTTYCQLINDRELERVNIGRRSFVVAESLYAYVERLRSAAHPD
ncbi:DNA-binding protein [Mycobacterium interjectum]|nr:DNA-binding protein [Mycobacterium interjectum]